MNKQTEALRMAKQHIIERKGGRGGAVCYVKSDEDVIKAIDEALEQPAQEYLTRAQQVIRANNSAQEPVAWTTKFDTTNIWESPESPGEPFTVPLYTHPAPSWQGLSDDEIEKRWTQSIKEKGIGGEDWVVGFARAIEQALKEKNNG